MSFGRFMTTRDIDTYPSIPMVDPGFPFIKGVDKLANFTEYLDSSVLDFASGSFVGRSVRFFCPLDHPHLLTLPVVYARLGRVG